MRRTIILIVIAVLLESAATADRKTSLFDSRERVTKAAILGNQCELFVVSKGSDETLYDELSNLSEGDLSADDPALTIADGPGVHSLQLKEALLLPTQRTFGSFPLLGYRMMARSSTHAPTGEPDTWTTPNIANSENGEGLWLVFVRRIQSSQDLAQDYASFAALMFLNSHNILLNSYYPCSEWGIFTYSLQDVELDPPGHTINAVELDDLRYIMRDLRQRLVQVRPALLSDTEKVDIEAKLESDFGRRIFSEVVDSWNPATYVPPTVGPTPTTAPIPTITPTPTATPFPVSDFVELKNTGEVTVPTTGGNGPFGQCRFDTNYVWTFASGVPSSISSSIIYPTNHLYDSPNDATPNVGRVSLSCSGKYQFNPGPLPSLTYPIIRFHQLRTNVLLRAGAPATTLAIPVTICSSGKVLRVRVNGNLTLQRTHDLSTAVATNGCKHFTVPPGAWNSAPAVTSVYFDIEDTNTALSQPIHATVEWGTPFSTN